MEKYSVMNLYESVYRSLLHHINQIVPDTVFVVEGESYGIDQDDGTGKSPAVTVTLDNMRSSAIELGSNGEEFHVVYTVTARSRIQRDALKYIVYSGIVFQPISIYDDFEDYEPISGAVIRASAQFDEDIYMKDTPNFSSDREKFFWVSTVLTTLRVLS